MTCSDRSAAFSLTNLAASETLIPSVWMYSISEIFSATLMMPTVTD